MALGVQMEREIREQPTVLAANRDRYLAELSAALRGRSFDLVLLAARGSSDNAALYARYLIEIHLGVPVTLAAPSVITRHQSELRFPGRTLAIGISQSGAAPDVSEVLAYMRRQGHTTLAVTNTAGSRLAGEAEFALELGVGVEGSIAATKTYSSSLLAMAQVVRALGADLPAPTVPDEAWVDACEAAADQVSGLFVRSSLVFCLARGYDFATAQETALKMMECAIVPAKSFSTADFAHGPQALAEHGTVALVYGEVPDGLSGTGTAVVPAPQSGQGVYDPLWHVVFGQWVALKVARARGFDPDRAQNLSKVTKTL